jgi:hypothetical protein
MKLVLFGWLVPGGGYLLLGRKRQFVAFLVMVSVAFAAGLLLQGSNLWPQPGELKGMDGVSSMLAQGGAVVKLVAGGPSLLAWLCGISQGVLEGRLHEYGTVFLIMAGLLNLLALTDVWELRKEGAR